MNTTIISVLSLVGAIICCVITVVNFFNGTKKDAVNDAKEDNKVLIKYRLDEMKEDIQETKADVKDIKLILSKYKDDFNKIVDEKIKNHERIYHSKDN